MPPPVLCQGVARLTALGLAVCASLAAQPPRITRLPDGIALAVNGHTTRLRVITPSIICVTVSPAGAKQHPSIAVLPPPAGEVPFKSTSAAGAALLTTSRLIVRVDASTGAITFAEAATEIPLTWNEAAKTLTIGPRRGSFPGMPQQRTFTVIYTSRTSATVLAGSGPIV